MFSTVLLQVTGYFDRRVLISTFFPSLVFLGGTLLLIPLIEVGGTRLLHAWNQQPGTVQAMLISGVLILIAFWTFALVNLRDTLDRLYQGYWPGVGLAEVVARRMRARFERRLDAVVIWPRPQPLLPSGSADLLQQAKTSLDLLLTLATFTWLFGVPLALWTVIGAAWPAHSPAVTVLAALALVAGTLLLASLARLAAAALLAVAVVALAVAPFSGSSAACADIARAGVFLLLAAGITLLSWALYRNAVQAGLAYGEQLKAVFDLHRWRVFEQFHLQAPQDLAEERGIWERLTIMLYRGTSDYHHFRYAAQDPAEPAAAAMPRFWVPTRDLPAYRPFAPADLMLAELGSTGLPPDAVEESTG